MRIAKYQNSNVTAGVLAPGRARPSASTVLFHIVCHVLETVDALALRGARPSVYRKESKFTVAVDVLAPMVPGHQQRQCSDTQCLPWLITISQLFTNNKCILFHIKTIETCVWIQNTYSSISEITHYVHIRHHSDNFSNTHHTSALGWIRIKRWQWHLSYLVANPHVRSFSHMIML